MKNSVFETFKGIQPNMNLNDYLALERTHLSVERTHLSYMRTVISMLVAAITLYKLLEGTVEGIAVAVILVISAAAFYIRGRKVCGKVRKNLKQIEDEDD